jgi:hypothetical protein
MGEVENPFNNISNECSAGNHKACPRKMQSAAGTRNCQCLHHKDTPTYVAETPKSNDTQWSVSHDN